MTCSVYVVDVVFRDTSWLTVADEVFFVVVVVFHGRAHELSIIFRVRGGSGGSSSYALLDRGASSKKRKEPIVNELETVN